MSIKALKTISVILCLNFLLVGCVSMDKSADKSQNSKKIVYITEDEEINDHYITQNSNSNENGSSDNNTSPDNASSDNNTSPDNASSDSLVEEEYKPISTGEWKQERFYIGSPFGPTSYEGLKTYKEAGFNLSKWALQADSTYSEGVKNANKVDGMYVLMWNNHRITQSGKGGTLAFNEKSIRNSLYMYSNIDPKRTIIGYQVWDEPILGKQYYSDANRMLSYLNKYDPNSAKLIVLLPSYGIYTWNSSDVDSVFSTGYEEYVENHILNVNPQILNVDYYPYLMGQGGYTGDVYRDLGLYRKMSLKYNKPFWFTHQITKVNGKGKDPTENERLFQMYIGLAYGAKCLMGWNQDATNNAGEKLDGFESAKARNTEIMAMGTYLLDKTTTEIYHTGAAGYYTDKFYLDVLSQSDLISSAPDNVIMSVFEDGKTNTRYLLVVNKNVEKAVTGKIALKTNKNISIFNRTTKSEDAIGSGSDITINIKAGGGEIYILK